MLLAVGTSLPVFALNGQSQAGARPDTGSLVDATDDEIAAAAIDHTRTRFNVVSGTPKVRLVRRDVTADDFPGLGLPSIRFSAQDPPLALVILVGDFDISNLRGAGRNTCVYHRVRFIAYGYDLQAGVPALTSTSPLGGRFRIALKDPTLPDDPSATPCGAGPASESTQSAKPMPPSPPSGPKPGYGSIAPPVTLPPSK